MKRGTCLGVMSAAAASSGAEAAAGEPPIQLNCDLAADPKKEKEFIKYFDTGFRPLTYESQNFGMLVYDVY
jgi:hypothetical protein